MRFAATLTSGVLPLQAAGGRGRAGAAGGGHPGRARLPGLRQARRPHRLHRRRGEDCLFWATPICQCRHCALQQQWPRRADRLHDISTLRQTKQERVMCFIANRLKPWMRYRCCSTAAPGASSRCPPPCSMPGGVRTPIDLVMANQTWTGPASFLMLEQLNSLDGAHVDHAAVFAYKLTQQPSPS